MSIELCFAKSNDARVVRMPILCHRLDKKLRITLTIACVAGAERGGKREEIIASASNERISGVFSFHQVTAKIVIGQNYLRPIYTAEKVWHGSDKNGKRTEKNSTDTSFTRLFFYRAERCEIMFWCG